MAKFLNFLSGQSRFRKKVTNPAFQYFQGQIRHSAFTISTRLFPFQEHSHHSFSLFFLSLKLSTEQLFFVSPQMEKGGRTPKRHRSTPSTTVLISLSWKRHRFSNSIIGVPRIQLLNRRWFLIVQLCKTTPFGRFWKQNDWEISMVD